MASNIVADALDISDNIEPDTRKWVGKCVNRVTLIGNVGRGWKHRGTSEHSFSFFPLATNIVYRMTDKECIIETDWHRVAVFRPGLWDGIAFNLPKKIIYLWTTVWLMVNTMTRTQASDYSLHKCWSNTILYHAQDPSQASDDDDES